MCTTLRAIIGTTPVAVTFAGVPATARAVVPAAGSALVFAAARTGVFAAVGAVGTAPAHRLQLLFTGRLALEHRGSGLLLGAARGVDLFLRQNQVIGKKLLAARTE